MLRAAPSETVAVVVTFESVNPDARRDRDVSRGTVFARVVVVCVVLAVIATSCRRRASQ